MQTFKSFQCSQLSKKGSNFARGTYHANATLAMYILRPTNRAAILKFTILSRWSLYKFKMYQRSYQFVAALIHLLRHIHMSYQYAVKIFFNECTDILQKKLAVRHSNIGTSIHLNNFSPPIISLELSL